MKLLVSAGEPSGDQRGAELLARLEGATAFGLGGTRLEGAGMELTRNMSEVAVMGFTEIAASIPDFLRLEKELTAEALERRPDCILLVDYPGFNMRLGRRLRRAGFPVVHYVAPQMWAWGGWRVGKLKRSCDLLMTLFRFEEDFFRKRGVNAVFTGHPLRDRIERNTEPGTLLGLLPGSRAQEVRRLLPEMLKAFGLLRERGVVESAMLAVSDHLDPDLYSEAARCPGLVQVSGTDAVLRNSRAALVCSGTATLETALHGVPFTVCYATSPVTYALAKLLVSGVSRIGMANIVAQADVATELIQNEVTPANMADSVEPFFVSDESWSGASSGLELVRRALGPGDAAGTAAERLKDFIEEIHGSR